MTKRLTYNYNAILLTSILAAGYFSHAYATDGVVYNTTISYENLAYPDSTGATFFTGIRGDSIIGGYLITGTPNTGGLVYSQSQQKWINFPENNLPVNLTGASTNNPYSATWGISGNTQMAVGTYKDPSYSDTYDLSYLYNPNVSQSSQLTTLKVPAGLTDNGNSSDALFTIVHSISGNFLVGNYNTADIIGSAFIYNIADTTGTSPVTAGTYQSIHVPNSVITSVYGIYGQYIAGGFSNSSAVKNELSHGFIAKINDNGSLGNTLQLDHPNGTITHFEGITGGGKAGHFNLVATYTDSTGEHASYAHVVWDGKNDLSHAGNSIEWFDYTIPGATIATANSGYQSTVVGTYQDGAFHAYAGTINNVTENGITHLIYDPFANNSGTIVTTSDGETAVDASVSTAYGNEYNDVINSGIISTSGTNAHGIISSGYGVTTNTGTITVTGDESNAIRLQGDYTTLLNYGEIDGNYGTLTSPNYTVKIVDGTTGAYIVNYNNATITYSGQNGAAISNQGSASLIDNAGTITASGSNSYAILSTGNSVSIANSGTVTASGTNAVAIRLEGDNGIINNTGTVQSTASNGVAIQAVGNNNTVNINPGSVIIGTLASSGTGNSLNVNTGLRSAQSYAYSTTGDWNFSDADSTTRPAAFSASAGAASAGIGVQETAGEMLYEHTSAINESLTQHILNISNTDSSHNMHEIWVDPYYSRNTRDASTTNPDINKFTVDSFGATAGFKTPMELTRLDVIANVQSSELNIQDSSQKVSANSIMLGVSTPQLYQLHGVTLSAQALAGYTAFDANREVITNTGSGSQQVTSDYSSYSGVIGGALTRVFPINDLLSASLVTGVDLAVERYNSHTESAYFYFDDRTITQLSSRIEGGLEARTADNTLSVFGHIGLANRRLLNGQEANYEINGIAVTFDGGKDTDTYVTEQIGSRYKLSPATDFLASLGAGQSFDQVRSFQGNIGVSIKF